MDLLKNQPSVRIFPLKIGKVFASYGISVMSGSFVPQSLQAASSPSSSKATVKYRTSLTKSTF